MYLLLMELIKELMCYSKFVFGIGARIRFENSFLHIVAILKQPTESLLFTLFENESIIKSKFIV